MKKKHRKRLFAVLGRTDHNVAAIRNNTQLLTEMLMEINEQGKTQSKYLLNIQSLLSRLMNKK